MNWEFTTVFGAIMTAHQKGIGWHRRVDTPSRDSHLTCDSTESKRPVHVTHSSILLAQTERQQSDKGVDSGRVEARDPLKLGVAGVALIMAWTVHRRSLGSRLGIGSLGPCTADQPNRFCRFLQHRPTRH